jgi:hypothetical protein
MGIMIFDVITQYPKPFSYGQCYLDIDKAGTASLFDPTQNACRATIERVKIDLCGNYLMILSGMQPDGITRTGVPKFTYQEWVLRRAL